MIHIRTNFAANHFFKVINIFKVNNLKSMIKSKNGIKPIEINIVNLNRTIEVEGGITLAEIAEALGDNLNFKPICARVNNKTEGLHYPIYVPKTVEFLDRCSDSGQRAYTRSLCMMLYHVVVTHFPGATLRIEHSLSNGYYCRIDGVKVDETTAETLRRGLDKLRDANLPFEFHTCSTSEVIEKFEREGLASKVLLLRTSGEPYTSFYTLDSVSDSYYGCLAPRTGLIDVYDITTYRGEGFLLRAFDTRTPSVTPPVVVQDKMYTAFTDHVEFNHIIGVSNVGELNERITHGRPADLINVAETLHTQRLGLIGDEIARRYRAGGARIVLIAGPSSSGKTTTTKRLSIQLMTHLLRPIMISLDDYFVNRINTPLDEQGDYDYESLYALDIEQFNTDLNRIIAGEEVELPSYSFETGERRYRGNRVRLDSGSIILIEGIHGLNPELTAHIADDMKFRVYVSALTTLAIDDHNWIPTTDNRLLRRIVRDFKYRSIDARQTIARWPSVRRGEEKWIFPYQENADAMFNSSLLFELAVIKDYATAILDRVPHDCPEYSQAYRLRKFLSYFRQIDASAVPPTSLLREFVGGSSFHY